MIQSIKELKLSIIHLFHRTNFEEILIDFLYPVLHDLDSEE
jgi:hypothetical protein